MDAVSLLAGRGAEESEWVGGSTYQKEVFAYLLSALQSSVVLESLFKHDGSFREIYGKKPLLLFGILGAADADAGLGVDLGSHIRVINEGHPIIKNMFDEFCALVT